MKAIVGYDYTKSENLNTKVHTFTTLDAAVNRLKEIYVKKYGDCKLTFSELKAGLYNDTNADWYVFEDGHVIWHEYVG